MFKFKNMRIFAVMLLAFVVIFALAACNNDDDDDNGDENGSAYTENNETPEPSPEPEPEPSPEPEPTIDPTLVFTPSEGSISLRVETMGNQQWDGVQIPSAELGLQAGNVYEFSVDFFTPMSPDYTQVVGLLMQTSGPLWRHIEHSELFDYESPMEWHNLSGTLDLTEVETVPTNIMIVKSNQGGADQNENILFYIDNFIVYRDGEQIAMFNFENNRTATFTDSGSANITNRVADPATARPPNPEWDMALPSLAARWADLFIIGNILEPPLIRDNPRGVLEMFLHQYTAITAENAMKVNAVSGGSNQTTRPAQLQLAGPRAIVDFAEAHNLYMIGHTLVWHSQSAPWLYRNPNTGGYLTRAEAMENMRWFIEQYAGYFGNRIDAWDVTNEVFTNNGGANTVAQGPEGSVVYDIGTWQRALRNNVPWYHAFANGADFDAGERAYDYIYYAFVFARRYAPTALLIYNDFNEETPNKRNAMASMVEEFNERWHADSVNNPAYGNPSHRDYGRLLIEVIGMQGHYNHGTNMAHIRDAIERFSQTGTRIHVTELDIHFRGQMPEDFTMSDANMYRQAQMFAQLFTWYEEFADYIDRITFWGREDATSWRGDAGATHFDRFYRPKPAFWAVYDPVGWRDRI